MDHVKLIAIALFVCSAYAGDPKRCVKHSKFRITYGETISLDYPSKEGLVTASTSQLAMDYGNRRFESRTIMYLQDHETFEYRTVYLEDRNSVYVIVGDRCQQYSGPTQTARECVPTGAIDTGGVTAGDHELEFHNFMNHAKGENGVYGISFESTDDKNGIPISKSAYGSIVFGKTYRIIFSVHGGYYNFNSEEFDSNFEIPASCNDEHVLGEYEDLKEHIVMRAWRMV